jgi:hypothetical protein
VGRHPGTVALSDHPFRLPPLGRSTRQIAVTIACFKSFFGSLALGRASTPLPFADAFRLNATVPSGQPAKVGGVFGRLADLQYSQGLASGSIARSMSLTDHSDRPSAVM